MQKITPFLWFDNNAKEAMDFYISVFKNSKIINVSRYGEGAPLPAGEIMTGTIQLEGQQFMVLNGGPVFKFNEAISFFVNCESQEEIDDIWNKLTSNGGQESQCGWLKDKFGVSWQIVPSMLGSVLNGSDKEGSQRVLQAMLGMKKLVIEDLQKAYDGK